MAEAGWFRDPQDPQSEVYYDGQNWTSYRRPVPPPAPLPAPEAAAWAPPPAAWSPPGPTAGWAAPTTPLPAGFAGPPLGAWEALPGPRRRRLGRGRLMALVAVAVVAAAGLVTWRVWPGDDTPAFTWGGTPIHDAAGTLTTAEARLGAYVTSRHGVRSGATRCYFLRLPTRDGVLYSGGHKTDIGDHLACGPVLFVDGDPAKPWVMVPVAAQLLGPHPKTATLVLPAQFTDLPSAGAPSDQAMVRPDGRRTPSGTGGLKVPPPPPTLKDSLTLASLGRTPAPKALVGARVIGKTTGFVVDEAGIVPRYGTGDAARTAPAGQQLIAFQLDYVAGDVTDGPRGTAMLIVNGGAPHPVDAADGDDWMIAAVPVAATVQLQLDEGGFTQSLTLPGGRPGPGNLAVLTRTHRSSSLRTSAVVHAVASNGSASRSLNLHAHLSAADVDFWAPGNPGVHAPDGRHALLTSDLVYTDPGQPGHTFGFEPSLVRLRLPGGRTVTGRNIARKGRVFDVFTVPATFTSGSLVVSGTERFSGGISLRITRPVSFPISIPAG